MFNLPIVAIIGRPNVGKSRLFNRLIGEKKSIVSDIPGTTRDRIFSKITNQKYPFILVDTGGIELYSEKGSIDDNVQNQVKIILNDADILLFLVDSQTGLIKQDYEVIEMLRKSKSLNNKSIIFALSKCDYPLSIEDIANYYSLGFKKILQISSIHKHGIDDLEKEIQSILKTYKINYKYEEIDNKDIPKIIFLGRPNVGKSSMINALINEERLVVSNIPGTTRDSTDTEIMYNNKKYILIDTAGFRRKGKIEKGIEKWSVTRSIQSMERADIACILIDAEEGIVAQDQHIVGYTLNQKKGVILIVNKWDTQEKGDESRLIYLQKLQLKFPFLRWTYIVFVSSLTKKNIFKIFPIVDQIIEERKKRIETSKLNSFLREITAKHAPRGTKNKKPKIFYITQVDICPPKFKIFVNNKELFHFSYWRYLHNKIREYFGFAGTAIELDIENRRDGD